MEDPAVESPQNVNKEKDKKNLRYYYRHREEIIEKRKQLKMQDPEYQAKLKAREEAKKEKEAAKKAREEMMQKAREEKRKMAELKEKEREEKRAKKRAELLGADLPGPTNFMRSV
jgi:hypothetical protein